MFFFEIVFEFDFRIAIGKDIRESGNDLLYFGVGKFRANPDNKTSDLRHKLLASFVVDRATTLTLK